MRRVVADELTCTFHSILVFRRRTSMSCSEQYHQHRGGLGPFTNLVRPSTRAHHSLDTSLTGNERHSIDPSARCALGLLQLTGTCLHPPLRAFGIMIDLGNICSHDCFTAKTWLPNKGLCTTRAGASCCLLHRRACFPRHSSRRHLEE